MLGGFSPNEVLHRGWDVSMWRLSECSELPTLEVWRTRGSTRSDPEQSRAMVSLKERMESHLPWSQGMVSVINIILSFDKMLILTEKCEITLKT